MNSSTYAMLLAAGLSTRLRALSEQRPKPLLPVCNRPLVRWVADLCQHHGINDLVLNLHHLGDQIRAELGDGSQMGARVSYSPEPEILGTGGGIKAMAALMPRQTCLVANAKIVTDVDLSAVLARHRASGALATMVVRPDPNAERWGAIGVDPEGCIRRLLELRRDGAERATAHMFTGIHVLEPEFIDAIPDGPCCVVRTAYQTLFEQGAPLGGYLHEGYFYEHSTPARYLQGNFNLLRSQVRPAHARTPLTGVHSLARVDPSATLVEPLLVGPRARIGAGATVGPEVVLGADSRVAPGVSVEWSVVWNGVELRSSVSRAVVTPGGVVEVPDEGDPATRPR